MDMELNPIPYKILGTIFYLVNFSSIQYCIKVICNMREDFLKLKIICAFSCILVPVLYLWNKCFGEDIIKNLEIETNNLLIVHLYLPLNLKLMDQ